MSEGLYLYRLTYSSPEPFRYDIELPHEVYSDTYVASVRAHSAADVLTQWQVRRDAKSRHISQMAFLKDIELL